MANRSYRSAELDALLAADSPPLQEWKAKARAKASSGLGSPAVAVAVALAAVVGIVVAARMDWTATTLPFCDDLAEPDASCTPCPHGAACARGVATCLDPGTYLNPHTRKCETDTEYAQLGERMRETVTKRLQEMKGRHECGEEGIEYPVPAYDLKELVKHEFPPSQDLDRAWESFRGLKFHSWEDVRVNDEGRYEVRTSQKPLTCVAYQWALYVVPLTLIVLAPILHFYDRRQKEAKVAALLESVVQFLRAQGGQDFPVDHLRRNFGADAWSWEQVKQRVRQDPAIVQTERQVDGVQRTCWTISSFAAADPVGGHPQGLSRRRDPVATAPTRF